VPRANIKLPRPQKNGRAKETKKERRIANVALFPRSATPYVSGQTTTVFAGAAADGAARAYEPEGAMSRIALAPLIPRFRFFVFSFFLFLTFLDFRRFCIFLVIFADFF
jgi:hypothetical protein